MARTYRKAQRIVLDGEIAQDSIIGDRVKRGFTQGYKEYLDEEAARRRRVESAWTILWWLEAMD